MTVWNPFVRRDDLGDESNADGIDVFGVPYVGRRYDELLLLPYWRLSYGGGEKRLRSANKPIRVDRSSDPITDQTVRAIQRLCGTVMAVAAKSSERRAESRIRLK